VWYSPWVKLGANGERLSLMLRFFVRAEGLAKNYGLTAPPKGGKRIVPFNLAQRG